MYITDEMKIQNIVLPAIDGTIFDLHSIEGKPFMLSFFRFASCPFCNMRMHELVKRYDDLSDDFTIVAIFDSPIDNLILHAEGHNAPFPILADEDNLYYKQYGIEHSIMGVIKGILFRMPTLLRGMAKGYIPTTIKGNMTTIPADFLVDAQGIVHQEYYGKDEGDHLPFERVKEFSHQQSSK